MKWLSLVIAVTMLFTLADAGSGSAEDGFFSRFHPLRWFRSPAADVSLDQRQELIRSKLQGRGIDPDVIDQRIARATAAAESSGQQVANHREARPKPSPEELSAELEPRGWDADQMDARIARAIDGRSRLTDRVDGYRPPSGEAIEARVPSRDAPLTDNRDPRFLRLPVENIQNAQPSRGSYRWTRGR